MIDAYSQLYITDFGLAHIEEGVGMTMTGDLIGTLRYMSPEQAIGKRVVVDYRTDIYSLGVSLYEFLTTRPAFDGENRAALLKQISFEEPEHLNRVDHSIPCDLATIVHKAMEKNPDDRYGSAQDLVDDLRAFRAFQTIRAKPPTWIERLRKYTRRNQGAVAAVMFVLLLGTLGLAVSNYLIASQRDSAQQAWDAEKLQRREVERQRDEVERQRNEAEASKSDAERLRVLAEEQSDSLRRSLYVADVRLAGTALEREDSYRLQASLLRGIPQESQPDLRGWEWYDLLAAGTQQERTMFGHWGSINSCALSPNARWLATVGFNRPGVVIWDAESEVSFREFYEVTSRLQGAAWTPDSKLFASGEAGGNHDIHVWDVDSREDTVLSGHENWITSLDFSPNGKILASTSRDGVCRIWDVQSRSCIFTLNCESPTHVVKWHANGQRVFIGGGDSEMGAAAQLIDWNPFSGEKRHAPLPGNSIDCLACTSDEDFILTGTRNGTCLKIDASTLEIVRETQAHQGSCNAIAIMDDQQFVTGGTDDVLQIWSLEELAPVRSLIGHSGNVQATEWDSTRGQLISTGTDGAVRLWDVTRPDEFREAYPANEDGRRFDIWSAGHSSNIEPIAGSNAVVYRRRRSEPIIVPLDADAEPHVQASKSIFELRSLGTGDAELSIEKVLRLAAEEQGKGYAKLPEAIEQQLGAVDWPFGLFWSSDRSKVVNLSYRSDTKDNLVQVGSIGEGRRLYELGPYSGLGESLWSPDGKWLAIDGCGLWLFDMDSGELFRKLDYELCAGALGSE